MSSVLPPYGGTTKEGPCARRPEKLVRIFEPLVWQIDIWAGSGKHKRGRSPQASMGKEQ